MKNRRLAVTRALVQITTTNGAKPLARLMTQRLLWQSHDNFLLEIRAHINFRTWVWGQTYFCALDFNFLSERSFFIDVTGIRKSDWNLYLTDDRCQASATGRSHCRRETARYLNNFSCPGCFTRAANCVIKTDDALIDKISDNREASCLFIDDDLARPSFQFVDLYQHDDPPQGKSGKRPV